MQNIINFQLFLAANPTLFISLIVWSIVWKGFALWKAGKNRDFVWFVVLLIVNTLGLLEIVYLFAIKNKEEKSESTSSSVTTETKVETVTEEKKEEVAVPVLEIKIEEASVTELKPEEIKVKDVKSEETKSEEIKTINQ
jgi:methionyl-tRNA synthetase